jgi:hypothetical protein
LILPLVPRLAEPSGTSLRVTIVGLSGLGIGLRLQIEAEADPTHRAFPEELGNFVPPWGSSSNYFDA